MTIQLDGRLKLALQEREIKDIDSLSANEMFEEYCNWHGIINWADNLREVLDSARAYKHEIETRYELELTGSNGSSYLLDKYETRLAAQEAARNCRPGTSCRIIEVTRSVVYVSVPISNKDR
jgi:hypothetical protein